MNKKFKFSALDNWKSMRCNSTRTHVWEDEKGTVLKTCTTFTGTEVFRGSAFHCKGCLYDRNNRDDNLAALIK